MINSEIIRSACEDILLVAATFGLVFYCCYVLPFLERFLQLN